MKDGIQTFYFDDSKPLRANIESLIHRPVKKPIRVIEHAFDYTAIEPEMVLRLGDADYYILSEAREGRFGIDEQPKMWVKYAFDLQSGQRKIIKLPFYEQFSARIGPFRVRCVRKPDKESRVLKLVENDLRFMQGQTVYDVLGNNIRVIDQIRGRSLYQHVFDMDLAHEQYYYEKLPGILDCLMDCLEGLVFLHKHGQQHGDVRNDHILIDRERALYRWIDFDYEANYQDFDVWSVGNLLSFVVGQGLVTCREVNAALTKKQLQACITPDDALFFFEYRLANLKKLYPYIPHDLNDLLMRFSTSTTFFYESIADIVKDVRQVLPLLSA